jgi:predicted dehydrogenase
MKVWRIGLIGCGSVSYQYGKTIAASTSAEIVSCWDTDPERMGRFSQTNGVRSAGSFNDLVLDEHIDVVLNLTDPRSHFEVSLMSLDAGKHVYSEKPLALSLSDAGNLVVLADQRNVRLGCAPDTFMSPPLVYACNAIKDGLIGQVFGFTASLLCIGHEWWHPRPDYYYSNGGGPLWDMGPYYVSALSELLGPVRRVCSSSTTGFKTRYSHAPGAQPIAVSTPTHICSILDFEDAVVGTLVTSFDVWKSSAPFIEIYGSLGTMRLPDPNEYFGEVETWMPPRSGRWKDQSWNSVFVGDKVSAPTRGIGLLQMLKSIENGEPHLANGERAVQVVKVLNALSESQYTGKFVTI